MKVNEKTMKVQHRTHGFILFLVYENRSNPILSWVSVGSLSLTRSIDDFDPLERPIFLHLPNVDFFDD